MTQKQLTLGAGGFIIVKDDEEAALALPRTYGVDDIPLTLTSRRFTTIDGVQNQLQYAATAYGDAMFSNGTMNAQFTLPRQMVRLRLHNSEIERDYNIGFNDGRTFYVIGNDGGLLSAPVPVTHLIMAPAERYEVIVDLTNDVVGTSINLEAHNGPDSGLSAGFAGYENASSGELGSTLNYRTFTLLHVNIGPPRIDGITTLPATLASNAGLEALTLANATQTRQLGISGGGADGPFTFNDLPFDMERIDQAVTLGTTEAWTVGSGAVLSHSFHIHGVQFRIVARSGDPSRVNPWEQGWKDTIYLPISESVTFVTRFDETADARYPFMYHCHMINHEDEGLMGQFTVQ
jgi:bilirubin oxidase